MRDRQKVAVIGFGAMAKSIAMSLKPGDSGVAISAALMRPGVVPAGADGMMIFYTVDDLIAWGPSIVIECAGHAAVRDAVPPLLRAGIDVILASVGSLGDPQLYADLEAAAKRGDSRLTVASGAIGGLDVLRAARIAGLNDVTYRGVKSPAAWKGTPAETAFDLTALTSATVIFDGTAGEAARTYPKNANVTAAVALAGIGFERTRVTLVADPAASGNSHTLSAKGAFGNFSIILDNQPLPDNPKTSWLAALSIEQALLRSFQTILA